MSRSPYRAQAALLQENRVDQTIWRLAAGLVVAAIVMVTLNSSLQAAIMRLAPSLWVTHFSEAAGLGQTPFSMLVTLFSFGFLIIGISVALRLVHKRGLSSLLGPRSVFIGQSVRVLSVLLAIGAVLLVLPPYNLGMELVDNLPFSRWLVLLPFGLVAVFIQSASEEILFRGYIQQQLAARFSHPAIWMALPALLFAFGHYVPADAGDNALLLAIWSGLFGVLMADLTARAGSLGPAIILHTFNNVSALLFVSLPDNLNGLALYVTPVGMNDTELLRAWLPVDFATTIVFWLAARLAIRR
ncbi:MAG: lysostaphin resistance A-like protein [Paracoccaceae bacterium]